jgi:hypothetical protein
MGDRQVEIESAERPDSCAFKFFTASTSAGVMGSIYGALSSTWGPAPVQTVAETSLLHVGKVRPSISTPDTTEYRSVVLPVRIASGLAVFPLGRHGGVVFRV